MCQRHQNRAGALNYKWHGGEPESTAWKAFSTLWFLIKHKGTPVLKVKLIWWHVLGYFKVLTLWSKYLNADEDSQICLFLSSCPVLYRYRLSSAALRLLALSPSQPPSHAHSASHQLFLVLSFSMLTPPFPSPPLPSLFYSYLFECVRVYLSHTYTLSQFLAAFL